MKVLQLPAQAWRLALGYGLPLGMAATLAPPPPAQAVDLPRPGILCDAPQQVCFDSRGPSLPITRMVYGPQAGNRLLAQLSGRPPAREIQLSEGQLCDLNQRVCWDDGWRRRRVNTLLSRHLFGATAATGGNPNRPLEPAATNQGQRRCKLQRRKDTILKGSCRLYRQNEGFGRYYVVRFDQGQLYRFMRRGSSLLLSDATGTWPVMVQEKGESVQFRWADLQLEVSKPAAGTPALGSAFGGSPGPVPRSSGETAPDLLDSLFQ